MAEGNYKPGQKVDDRKTRFAKINRWVTEAGGWVVSIPGQELVTIETLPQSPIPARLIELGYDVQRADPPETQRILAGAIIEQLALTSSGALVPLTPESTKTIAETRTHAGIVRVSRFSFAL